MDNRIRQITVHNGQLIPAQAEVWITVVPEYQTATTEVRGRLMGPHCSYANTVEVAYSLRPPPPSHTLSEKSGITMRAVIPEASLWEPQCPFLYQGLIELWQDGQRCDRMTLSHGLRYFLISERGLRLNGRTLMLHGRLVSACSDEDALTLRQTGCNLLIVPVEADTLPVWERADRLGFFVLGRLKDDSEETLRFLPMLSRHTSCLGWLVEKGKHPPLDLLPSRVLLGLVCEDDSPQLPLWTVHFLFGSAELANLGKPLLVTGDGPFHLEGCPILGNVL